MPSDALAIVELEPATHAPACDGIIRGLPDWFGVPAGIAECAVAVRTTHGLVATDARGVAGFLTDERRSASIWEITWMAVRADRRGSGIGSQLVSALIAQLPDDARLLVVKTLSDREGDPGPEYGATRAFYLARGFRPAAELDLWGAGNPCQLLARRLESGSA
jgi:GNAT superfamily N-acetyltransferase